MTKQELLDMSLHETKVVTECKNLSVCIMRVVGGWIYYRTHFSKKEPLLETGVFVPEPEYNNDDYAGYDEWLALQDEYFPEPEDFGYDDNA